MNLLEFLKVDFSRSLFPLNAPIVYVENGEASLRSFVYNDIFGSSGSSSGHFVQTPVAYALMDKLHLRKLLALDPIAMFYLYDFVLRNSAAFQKSRVSSRSRYGYAFQGTD